MISEQMQLHGDRRIAFAAGFALHFLDCFIGLLPAADVFYALLAAVRSDPPCFALHEPLSKERLPRGNHAIPALAADVVDLFKTNVHGTVPNGWNG